MSLCGRGWAVRQWDQVLGRERCRIEIGTAAAAVEGLGAGLACIERGCRGRRSAAGRSPVVVMRGRVGRIRGVVRIHCGCCDGRCRLPKQHLSRRPLGRSRVYSQADSLETAGWSCYLSRIKLFDIDDASTVARRPLTERAWLVTSRLGNNIY